MKKDSYLIIIALAVIIFGLGYWWWVASPPADPNADLAKAAELKSERYLVGGTVKEVIDNVLLIKTIWDDNGQQTPAEFAIVTDKSSEIFVFTDAGARRFVGQADIAVGDYLEIVSSSPIIKGESLYGASIAVYKQN